MALGYFFTYFGGSGDYKVFRVSILGVVIMGLGRYLIVGLRRPASSCRSHFQVDSLEVGSFHTPPIWLQEAPYS